MQAIVQKYFTLVDVGKRTEVQYRYRKEKSAISFLRELHSTIVVQGKELNLPDKKSLKDVVDSVISGYEAKMGIFSRIWNRVWIFFGGATDLQKIEKLKGEIQAAEIAKDRFPVQFFRSRVAQEVSADFDLSNKSIQELINIAETLHPKCLVSKDSQSGDKEIRSDFNDIFLAAAKIAFEDKKIKQAVEYLSKMDAVSVRQFYRAADILFVQSVIRGYLQISEVNMKYLTRLAQSIQCYTYEDVTLLIDIGNKMLGIPVSDQVLDEELNGVLWIVEAIISYKATAYSTIEVALENEDFLDSLSFNFSGQNNCASSKYQYIDPKIKEYLVKACQFFLEKRYSKGFLSLVRKGWVSGEHDKWQSLLIKIARRFLKDGEPGKAIELIHGGKYITFTKEMKKLEKALFNDCIEREDFENAFKIADRCLTLSRQPVFHWQIFSAHSYAKAFYTKYLTSKKYFDRAIEFVDMIKDYEKEKMDRMEKISEIQDKRGENYIEDEDDGADIVVLNNLG